MLGCSRGRVNKFYHQDTKSAKEKAAKFIPLEINSDSLRVLEFANGICGIKSAVPSGLI